MPIDAGFNRLAWFLPYAIFVLGAGGLVIVARRLGKKRETAVLRTKEGAGDIAERKRDEEYQRRLDDDLDDLD